MASYLVGEIVNFIFDGIWDMYLISKNNIKYPKASVSFHMLAVYVLTERVNFEI